MFLCESCGCNLLATDLSIELAPPKERALVAAVGEGGLDDEDDLFM